jgi:putative ABC transport system permease protein
MIAWNIRPIASALWRSPTGALLVALQIAIGLAVLVNAIYIVKQRVDKIGRPDGMDTPNIFVVASTGFTTDFDYLATLRNDLAWIREQPGVIAATPTRSIPLSGGGSATGVSASPDTEQREPVNYYLVDEQSIDALGLKMVAGRAFEPQEILPPTGGSDFTPQVIVTKPLADALFPDSNALGNSIYDDLDNPSTIIGIVEHMHGAWLEWDKVSHVMLMPRLPFGPTVYYMVRAEPGQRDAMMRTVEEHLATSDPNRLLRWVRTLESFKERSYLGDRNMAIFLVSVTGALLAITALGVFGLATFNVSTRIRQIGTRRAVGARRSDIVRHFLVENWMVTTAGVIVGCGLALAAGYWLSIKYELPRLDLYYLVGGVLAVWFIGLAAAWQPARRASAISPAVATRTV